MTLDEASLSGWGPALTPLLHPSSDPLAQRLKEYRRAAENISPLQTPPTVEASKPSVSSSATSNTQPDGISSLAEPEGQPLCREPGELRLAHDLGSLGEVGAGAVGGGIGAELELGLQSSRDGGASEMQLCFAVEQVSN